MAEEIQKEELEVLDSIYEGDEAFKKISDKSFQYKYGEDGKSKSFMVEINWSDAYPDVAPDVNVELFYNKHVLPVVKDKIKSSLLEQAADFLGMSMTFSLFEWVKDNLDTLLEEQTDMPLSQNTILSSNTSLETEAVEDSTTVKKEKKEQLTKAQKRRIFDRFGANTDRPRGWDWVDIIRHLSQTGGQKGES